MGILEIVLDRYASASEAFIANSEAVRTAITPGISRVSPELEAIQSESYFLKLRAELEIESYYLFAKIVLDDVARAIEYYFGAARGLPLKSHDNLARHLREYAGSKRLRASEELFSAIADLKTRVCDYRDHEITHEQSPRSTNFITWSRDSRRARIAKTRLYPKKTDAQSESELLDVLRESIGAYLDLVADFLAANEGKTNLSAVTP